MAASKSAMSTVLRACERLSTRPAPWGAEQFQSEVPRPVHISEPSRMLSGIMHRSPRRAEMAPLRIMLSSLM